MDDRKAVAAVVSPFGAFGGRYEVDADGLRIYRISWAVVILAIATMTIGPFFDLPQMIGYGALAVGFVISLILCILTVRNGRKL